MGDNIRDSVVNMVAAVLGMIPEGLVLLTSVALTLGALKLAQKKTLVQELYCIETLARVDTLCLDKTGTITEGTMCVEAVESYPPVYDEISEKISGKDPESGEGDSDGTEVLLPLQFQQQMLSQRRMEARISYCRKSQTLTRRNTVRRIRRRSGRSSISWEICFLC